MKRLFFIPFLIISAYSLTAQFGINLGYKTFSASSWEESIQRISSDIGRSEMPLDRGLSVGIDYWFRLKNKRIEFLPELNYSRFSKTWSNADMDTDKISSSFYSIYANTNVYLFDLAGDCDCPTFSKDGDVMKKGFFIQVSPGLSWVQNKYSNLITNTKKDANTITPSIGLGVGLDIGISDLFTITPIVSYRHHFGVEWSDFHTYFQGDPPLVEADNTAAVGMFNFGLHFSLRFND